MANIQFYYPMTLQFGSQTWGQTVEFKDTLPIGLQAQSPLQAVVLTSDQGLNVAGLYAWLRNRWLLVMPFSAVCEGIIDGAQIIVALNQNATDFTKANYTTALYKMGLLYNGTVTDTNLDTLWGVSQTPVIGSGSGTVKSVNSLSPDVNGNIAVPLISLSDVQVTEGSAIDGYVLGWSQADGKWIAKPLSTGDVKSVSGQIPDAGGNVVVQATDANTASGQSLIVDSGATTGTSTFRRIATGSATTLSLDANNNLVIGTSLHAQDANSATGNSLVVDGGPASGAITLRTLVAGTNVSITQDANSNLVINNTQAAYTLPAATTTTLGGVIIGSGVTLTGSTISVVYPVTSVSTLTGAVVIEATDNNAATGTTLISNSGATTGNIKLKTLVAGTNITLAADANGNIQINGSASGITQVASVGTGTSLVLADGTSGGIAQIKSLAAGSNITLTQDVATQTITITANQTLTPATTTTIGGVIVGAGLSVIANGTVSLAAPTGANLGGVKAGTGIAIGSDGTISVTAVGGVSSVSTLTGTVVVQATDVSTASGTSLITNSGATTANIVLRRIVAGTGITLATDANNNLVVTSTGGYTLPAATTTTLGGIIVGSGLSVTADGTLSATATGGGVTSITAGTSGALTGAVTFTAGSSISLSNTGNSIQISGTGVAEAPNDGTLYGRENMAWVAIPAVGSAITSLTSDATAGSVSILETQPNVNTAITKSLTAGTNVTFTDNGSNIVIAASIPAGTVSTVNSVSPNSSGNVALTAANVNAVPVAGNVTMTGPLNMGSQELTGLATPTVASDAVPLSYLQAMSIDNGTF